MPSITRYAAALSTLLGESIAQDLNGRVLDFGDATERVVAMFRQAGAEGGRLLFVGNGGSAAISSHMAIDYSKNGGLPSLAFNDGAALTCLGNDFDYSQVFSKQVEMHGRPEDVLIAISSSGKSANIINAVQSARAQRIRVITLSGFAPENPLRGMGDVNFYIPSDSYGFVEVGHLMILHCVLDDGIIEPDRAAPHP